MVGLVSNGEAMVPSIDGSKASKINMAEVKKTPKNAF